MKIVKYTSQDLKLTKKKFLLQLGMWRKKTQNMKTNGYNIF